MDVDDDDADLPRLDVLLVDEVCVQRDEDAILPLSGLKEIAVVEVGPHLMPGRRDLVVFVDWAPPSKFEDNAVLVNLSNGVVQILATVSDSLLNYVSNGVFETVESGHGVVPVLVKELENAAGVEQEKHHGADHDEFGHSRMGIAPLLVSSLFLVGCPALH